MLSHSKGVVFKRKIDFSSTPDHDDVITSTRKKPYLEIAVNSNSQLDGLNGEESEISPDLKTPLGRRTWRSSSDASHRSSIHQNFNDPLNLTRVKPDNPNDANFSKPLSITKPKNISDPLNLLDEESQDCFSATSSWKSLRGRKRRDSTTSVQKFTVPSKNLRETPTYQQASNQWAIEEPGCLVKESEPSTSHISSLIKSHYSKDIKIQGEERLAKRKLMSERYRYGNFNFLQPVRLPPNIPLTSSSTVNNFNDSGLFQMDPRVELFLPEWVINKSVLDIGCNAGLFTISLAHRYQLKRIVGIDLDEFLVRAARKKLRHIIDKSARILGKFPPSFPAIFGPISTLFRPSVDVHYFPNNIFFLRENYILDGDDKLENIKEEFDIIFALSTIKWIHLNWGDKGVHRFFKRAFKQLKVGGRFVLETESMKEYQKHCSRSGSKRPPDDVIQTFKDIQLKPEEFVGLLLSGVIGFSHFEDLDTPLSKSLGIKGRLQVFYKGEFMLRRQATPDVRD